MANKIMHHVVIGSDTFEIVDQYAREHGVPADDFAVGQALAALDDRIASISFDIIVDADGNATLVRSDMVNTEEVSY